MCSIFQLYCKAQLSYYSIAIRLRRLAPLAQALHHDAKLLLLVSVEGCSGPSTFSNSSSVCLFIDSVSLYLPRRPSTNAKLRLKLPRSWALTLPYFSSQVEDTQCYSFRIHKTGSSPSDRQRRPVNPLDVLIMSTLDYNSDSVKLPVPLDRNIRLLTIHASPVLTSEIRCSLGVYDLASKPKYEALSYTWGDPHQLFPITINKKNISTPA